MLEGLMLCLFLMYSKSFHKFAKMREVVLVRSNASVSIQRV